ncbi:MAG: hypothetical protein ABI217_09555, partial [Chthoniobacterales bacterium]
AIEAMDRAGYAPALTAFLHKLLGAHPEAPFWENYVQLAAKAGATEEMLALARSVAARPDFTGSRAKNFRLNFYKALLAADQVEEGVGEMRKLLALPDRDDRDEASPPELGLKLARLGQLLERKDWIEEGLVAAAGGGERSVNVDRTLKHAWLLNKLAAAQKPSACSATSWRRSNATIWGRLTIRRTRASERENCSANSPSFTCSPGERR